MDCCNNDEKMRENENITQVKGGKSIKMEKRIWLWVVIGVLFLLVLFLVFKAGTGGSSSTTIQAAGSAARTAASSSGMVGGC